MADLQKKIAELEASLAASATEKDDLTSINLDQAKQLEELKAENESLKSVNDALSNEVKGLSEKSLQVLVEKAKKKEKPKLSAETFEVEGTKYCFVSPVMMLKDKRVTNADVLASTDLQAQLVAAKSGMIKVVS